MESSDEEGWTRTSEGSIVTYDLFQSIATNGSYAEKYTPKTGNGAALAPPMARPRERFLS